MTSSQHFDGPVQVDIGPVDVDTETFVVLSEMVERDQLPLGDVVAAVTESRFEASIDARNGLRHHGGRRPVEADFQDIFTPFDEATQVGDSVVDGPSVLDETVQPGGAFV